MKSYSNHIQFFPPPPHNFILFELDFDVKFPLLRLLLFLSDLKSTIMLYNQLNLCLSGENLNGLNVGIIFFFLNNLFHFYKLREFKRTTKLKVFHKNRKLREKIILVLSFIYEGESKF